MINKILNRIAFFSAYIQSVHTFLLKKKHVDNARIHKNNTKDQGFFKNNVFKSCTNHNSSQDLSMYSYNPLRIKKAVYHNK